MTIRGRTKLVCYTLALPYAGDSSMISSGYDGDLG